MNREFDALNSQINANTQAFEAKRLQRKNRKRAVGAGHPFTLFLTDRLLMLLIYFLNTLGYLFNLSQISVLKSIKKLEPLVSEVLPLPKKEYDKVKRLQSVDEIEAMFPGFKAFLDSFTP